MKISSIAWIIIGLVCIYVWNVYNSAKRLTFGIGKIQNLRIASGTISMLLNLRATNGNATGVPLTGINIDNYFGSALIGKAILESSVYLNGRSTTDIPLRITIPLTDLLNIIPEIKSLLSTGIFSFTLKGTVSAVGITAPIEQNYTVKLNNIL